MATTAFIVTAAAAVGSTVASIRATNAQVAAQKKEARIQQRVSQIESVRRARRAVAQRRIQEAELLQAGATEGARTSSSISGAVGSLRTQTGANIGAANTRLAGDIAANRALITGANKARVFGNQADLFSGIGGIAQASGSLISQRQQRQQLQNLVENANRPLNS